MRRTLIPRGRTVEMLTAEETHTRQERLEKGERGRRKEEGGKGEEERQRRK